MRKISLLCTMVTLMILGTIVWIRSGMTSVAISPSQQSSSISTLDLHLRTDVRKLPVLIIDGIN
jgi:hypothetical protein